MSTNQEAMVAMRAMHGSYIEYVLHQNNAEEEGSPDRCFVVVEAVGWG